LHPFFPSHDLTHCAVESVLGFAQAFFGLVASGWEIDDFAAPGAARRLPREALLAECIVGILDLERAHLRRFSGAEFSEALGAAVRGQRLDPPEPLTEAALERIRRLRDQLESRWRALPPGATLEVEFPATSGAG
jgi:hypothetical protein